MGEIYDFCSLYSGSSGNSILVGSKTKILIDAGLSGKNNRWFTRSRSKSK